jgi:DNA-binding MarR family transcriptional regulator/N-acetylglutamate synthase-like GNAT family acetyltransferase
MHELVDSVRSFNRFFTRYSGALDPAFLGVDVSLAEARLLYEIAHADGIVATQLASLLKMDVGFVSRVLGRFEQRGWLDRGEPQADRSRSLSLTPSGRKVFDEIDRRQVEQVSSLLESLRPSQRRDLAAHLSHARLLMGDRAGRDFIIRTFRIGDFGYIAARQSLLYHEMYGWNGLIEANEGEVTSAFIRNFKEGRDQCWIAEIGGAMVGSIIVTDEGEGLSRLRLLYVESTARGLGVGTALVDECVAFAQRAGFARMTLWTHTILESARRIYAAKGFVVVERHEHDQFGPKLQGETWHLDLSNA